MKFKNAISVLITALFVCGAAVAQASAPKMEFVKTEYNFGNVPHKSKLIQCTFDFTNSGNAPLVVIKTETSCSCLKAMYPKKPILPGQKAKITVTYEPNKKEAGVFYKAIDVYTNSPARRQTIVVKGRAVD